MSVEGSAIEVVVILALVVFLVVEGWLLWPGGHALGGRRRHRGRRRR